MFRLNSIRTKSIPSVHYNIIIMLLSDNIVFIFTGVNYTNNQLLQRRNHALHARTIEVANI